MKGSFAPAFRRAREVFGLVADLALERRQQAITLFVLGAGGILLSRTVPAGSLSDEILEAASRAVNATGCGTRRSA